MTLAADITDAAAKAIAARDEEPWGRLRPLSRSYYYAHARAALAAALEAFAHADDDIHRHGGIRPVALAVLAVWRGLGGMDDITLSDLTIDEDEA